MDEFIGNMSTQNFDDVGKFFDTIPKLQHVITIKNPKTKKRYSYKLWWWLHNKER